MILLLEGTRNQKFSQVNMGVNDGNKVLLKLWFTEAIQDFLNFSVSKCLVDTNTKRLSSKKTRNLSLSSAWFVMAINRHGVAFFWEICSRNPPLRCRLWDLCLTSDILWTPHLPLFYFLLRNNSYRRTKFQDMTLHESTFINKLIIRASQLLVFFVSHL